MKTTKYTKPWIDALRSGDYKQGHTFLHSHDKFCCLGVGLDVMGCEWVEHPRDRGTFAASDSLMSFHVLTPSQLQRLGISRAEMTVLYEANDVLHKSFDEIADAVEAAMQSGGKVKF